MNGKKVCEITGNYMGYIDIDGVRYWDLRDDEEFQKHYKPRTVVIAMMAMFDVISPQRISQLKDFGSSARAWEYNMMSLEKEFGERTSEHMHIAISRVCATGIPRCDLPTGQPDAGLHRSSRSDQSSNGESFDAFSKWRDRGLREYRAGPISQFGLRAMLT